MKPVVSNTTPLRYLIEIDAIHVLPFLFEKIVVPPVVIQELSHPRTPKKVREYMTSLPKWIEIRSVSIEDPTLDILDPGERDAILLAESLQAAGILLDEKLAREIAEQKGLRCIGTLRVLADAAKEEQIDLTQAIALLTQTTFRVQQKLIEKILKEI